MAGISLGGVNLDVEGIVSQLMSIEAVPFDKLEAAAENFETQLSELAKLKSGLSTFQTAMDELNSIDKFEKYKSTNSEDPSNQSFTTTLDNLATAGIYSIEVTSLASSHKLGQTVGTSYTTSHTVAGDQTDDPTKASGLLELSSGGKEMSVNIDGKNIVQTRDAINSAAEAADTGISAAIIQTGDNEFQLVLTATKTGTDNTIQVLTNNSDLDLGENIQTATDGIVKIDGYEVRSSTNEVKDAIRGVTLDLKQVSTGVAELEVSRDVASVTESINNFIESYNTLKNSLDTYEEGALKNDSSLQSIRNILRDQLNTSSGSGAYNFLSEIGVTSDAQTGDLGLNTSVLGDAINNDFDSVAKLFAEKDTGIASRLEKMADNFVSWDGLLATKKLSIDDRMRSNGDAQDNMSFRLELKEASYLKQYSALDVLIGKMNSASTSLAGQLASLPGFTD